MGYERCSDQQLLDATRRGDAAAFGEFFRRYWEPVLIFVRRRTGNAEMAADLVAETFAAALLSVHRGRASRVPNGVAWLTGIARNKLVDSYRAARIENSDRATIGIPRLLVDDEEIERIDLSSGMEHLVIDRLERLSFEEREAIVRRILNEEDYGQIARELGRSEAAVRKRVSRGLTHLREEMGVQPDE